MSSLRTLLGAAALAIALAPPAHAVFLIGKPVKVMQNNTIVTASFYSADPDRIGNLYFLGSGNRQQVLITANNNDSTDQGQFLFSNSPALNPPSVQLQGVFNKHDKLHFAFDIVSPESAASELFRTDRRADVKQFSYDKVSHLLAIEDTRRGTPGFDGDYNDLIVRFTFTVAPAPGSMALLGMSALLAFSPRRRKAT